MYLFADKATQIFNFNQFRISFFIVTKSSHSHSHTHTTFSRLCKMKKKNTLKHKHRSSLNRDSFPYSIQFVLTHIFNQKKKRKQTKKCHQSAFASDFVILLCSFDTFENEIWCAVIEKQTLMTKFNQIEIEDR